MLGHGGLISPDYFAAIPVGQIEGDEYDALRTIWPAAYEALDSLLRAEEDGKVMPNSDYFKLKPFDLIVEVGWYM